MTFIEQARAAQAASRVLATATRSTKDAALQAMADALLADEAAVLAANDLDVENARAAGTSEAIIDRLRLNPNNRAAHCPEIATVPRLHW